MTWTVGTSALHRDIEYLALRLLSGGADAPGPATVWSTPDFFARLTIALHRLREFLRTGQPDPLLGDDLLDLIRRGRAIGAHDQLVQYLAAAHTQVQVSPDFACLDIDGWSRVRVSAQTAAVPSMLEESTKRYYRWIAGQLTGVGSVVEVGSWLGSSTCCLADGMRAGRLHAFDSFHWQPWMVSQAASDGLDIEALAVPGALLATFRANTARYGDKVVPIVGHFGTKHPGDLEPEWSRTPIELLVYDMGPDWDVLEHMWRVFSSSLIPGVSYVVFQEYAKLESQELWRFHADHATELRPVHKPTGNAKAFRFTGGQP